MSVGRTNVSVLVGTSGPGENGDGGLRSMSNVVDGSDDPVDGRGELVDGKEDPESTESGGNRGESVDGLVAAVLNDGTVAVVILAIFEIVATTDRVVLRAGAIEDVKFVVARRVR